MRTPADLLTGAEKCAYTQSSPVSTTNIYYHQIMSLEEFKALSRQRKMLVLDAYKRRFKASEIAAAWNCSQANVRNYTRTTDEQHRALEAARMALNGISAGQKPLVKNCQNSSNV